MLWNRKTFNEGMDNLNNKSDYEGHEPIVQPGEKPIILNPL